MSADVTELAMSFDQAHDWITTSVDVGELAGRGRRAVAALLVELERRDQIIQSQAAALDEAMTEHDRARSVIRDAVEVLDQVRAERDQLRDRVAELEAGQGEPTGMEYGVHWSDEDKIEGAPEGLHGERYARKIVAQYSGQTELVVRTLGPWLPAEQRP